MGCLNTSIFKASSSAGRPGVAIGAMILNRNNKLLVGKRVKEQLFGYPGGHLEKFESWAECASREIEEETGLKIPHSDLIHTGTYNVVDKDSGYHYVEIDMAALMPEDQTPKNMEPDKSEDWIWVSEADMKNNLGQYFYPI